MFRQRWLSHPLGTATLSVASINSALASTTITGTVGSEKYLLTGSAVNVTTNAVLKISFETTTAGENLALCAGSIADFAAGRCATQLNDSGGPGFRFLTIVDTASLNGKHLYIIRTVGVNPASFSFTIE
jgi:hypothetical protein